MHKLSLVRHKKCLAALCLVALLIFALWSYLYAKATISNADEEQSFELVETLPVGRKQTYIVIWTGYPNGFQVERFCGIDICMFTSDRQFAAIAKAIVFYGSLIDINDLPLPRPPNQVWALFHEEIPYYAPFVPFEAFLQHFNYTSTFSRYSDVPLTTMHLVHSYSLGLLRYVIYTDDKDRFRNESHLASIAYIQSQCDTMSGRDEYVRELMKYIKIDSYGRCLHNKDFPASLDLAKDYQNRLMDDQFLKFLARYKFILAYENAVCDDYITDKLWRPLIVGAIPVYFGAPNFRDWTPQTKSAIYIGDFPSPAALAHYLHELDANNSEYLTYMHHKNKIPKVSNPLLYNAVQTYYMENYEVFMCYVCAKLSELPNAPKTASLSHYNCDNPNRHPRMRSQLKWALTFNYTQAKCEAFVVDQLLRRNVKYTKTEVDALKAKCNELS